MGPDRSERLDQLMEEAVAFSVDHVHKGGIPFTALVVDGNGTIIGRGVNRVRDHHDPERACGSRRDPRRLPHA